MSGRMRSDQIPSLNPRQLSTLRQRSTSGSAVIANLDALNEEIVEQAAVSGARVLETEDADVPETMAPATPETEKTMSMEPPEMIPDPEAELQQEIAALEAQLAAQREREAAAAEESEESAAGAGEPPTMEQQVVGMLHKHPKAPTEQQIAALKQKYGENGLNVIALGEDDVYIFTYLRRKQLQSIQQATAKQAQIEGMASDPEEYMTEQVLKMCVVWPKLGVNFWYNSRSGVIPTLYSAVMLNSYHLNPQQAMVLTAQL